MKLSNRLMTTVAAVLTASALLTACGGGGGGSPTPSPIATTTPTPTPTPTPTSGSLSWTQGVFEPLTEYEQRCENPRSGVDIEGNAYNDVQGELLQELFWLRSWTNKTYLWNNEVTDQDPAGFSDRVDYFDVLRTFETTASGADKDQFHFSQPTEDFLEQRNAAPTSGYGVEFAVFEASPPRDVRVLFTDPDTPASTPVNGQIPFVRGSKILEIDGVDMINGDDVDTLNAGLFPALAGETHTFKVQDPDGSEHTIDITSADIPVKPVNRTAILDTSSGKAGYILFNTFSPFSSEEAIATAITDMKTAGVNELVLDLRYNGGGLLAVAAQLGYMIAGPAATTDQDKIFEALRYNDDAGNTNPLDGSLNEPFPFIDTGVGFSLVNGAPLDSLDLDRVFILTTGNTCSASEAVINGLRGVDIEVVLIGDTTCGKPFGFVPTDNCGETYYTIQFQGQNDKGFGDYTDGFAPNDSSSEFAVKTPGCAVDDDFDSELGDVSEDLLATALSYIENGACPSSTVSSASSVATKASSPKPMLVFRDQAEGGEIATTGLSLGEYILRNNRDLRGPR